MKIFSVDAETDGLYGKAFAIAAVVYENGVEIARFTSRISSETVRDAWVQENVLPAVAHLPVTHPDSIAMEEAFWRFWTEHQSGATAIAHIGAPVETGLFRRCVERDASRTFQGPFPLHEVGTMLMAMGEDPSSVDAYVLRHGLEVPGGSPHDPLYDADVAARVWTHAIARIR
jgi:hypothetical protein